MYLFTAFISKSISYDMSIATAAFFWSPFVWNVFFQPFSFSLYVSVVLRWVSCRQHIKGSCFHIHPASLCLLVGTFNPSTFKVIINQYDSVAIYLLFWVQFYAPFLCFLSREDPLVFVGELVWWCWILSFCLSVKLLIFPSYLNKILAWYSNLGCRFFPFSSLDPAIPFWPAEFRLIDQLLSLWGFPCVLLGASPLLLLIFFFVFSLC